ncbi:hypothetical protein [Actinocorallia populi]|uniref:hypothetical protein n=1 Tax=Actinocorallia populi TaxID=2079200 RepID=UPI000D089E20|nr:hypothetical protein [Actinocorallia populi]
MFRRLPRLLTAAALGATLVAAPAAALPGERAAFLGPQGYGPLKLGMSLKAARKAGLVTKLTKADGQACGSFTMKKTGASVYYEKKRGVTAIFAAKSTRTPRGIKIGDRLKKVKQAYPGLKAGPNAHDVRVPGNRGARYIFLFDSSDRVYELTLARTPVRCFG